MDHRFMLSMAFRGFHAARARYNAESEEDAFLPASEAIYWACVLDEQLRDVDSHGYATSTDYGKKIMTGVRYAQNQVTHQIPMLFYRTEDQAYPLGTQHFEYEIRWRAASELPERPGANTPGGVQDGGRQAYISYLSDVPVRRTLDQIADWFAAVQNWPNSPLMPRDIDQGHSVEAATVFVHPETGSPDEG